MRTSLVCATFVAGVLALFAVTNLHAQRAGGAAAPAAHGVAIIDVGFIFKKHARYEQLMKQVKQDSEAAEAELKKERTRISELAKKLQEYRPGTPPYKKQEEEITQQEADFSVKVSRLKKDFMEREAKIHWTIYQEIATEVRYFSEQNGVTLVLQHNGSDQVNTSSPKSVISAIYRPVVYQRGVDITEPILAELNRRAVSNGGAPKTVNPGPAKLPKGTLNK